MLEQHHKKLAQILRFQHENPPSAAPNAPLSASAEPGTPKASPSGHDSQQQPPKLSGNTRLPKRETSSIASNLASARGIPSQPRRTTPISPTLSSQQAGAKMTDGPAKIRTSESRLRGAQGRTPRDRLNRTSSTHQPSWSPPTASPTDITSHQYVPSDVAEPRHRSRQPDTEEPFQRFYSSFEGLISKLSAPLAFAGLPLGPDASPQAESSRKSYADTKLDRHQATSGRSSHAAEPDVSRIFSRAALQAIRDSPGGNGTGGATGGPAESFYVVPTTGGTVSYAGILSRAEKEARRNSLEEGDEDFVDARETPVSPEMRHSFNGGSKRKNSRANDKLTTNLQNPKTMEELQMENEALRHLSDTLSKRLHMWEVNAQSSSMALQQSLKAMHHQTNASPEQASSAITSPAVPLPPQPSIAEHEQRIKELEEKLRRGEKELERAGRENQKLRSVVDRYKDRWERLKEGAKTRRAENKPSADPATAGVSAKAMDSPIPSGDGSRPESENENGGTNKDSDKAEAEPAED